MSVYLVDTKLNEDRDYFVIGDIHGCCTELKLLLVYAGFVINDNKIVRTDTTKNVDILLLGDYLDRGKESLDTINFLYDNIDNRIYFVRGNHEQIVYDYLVSKLLTNTHINPKTFNSIDVLQNNNILLTKFIALYNKSKYYFSYGDTYIITHAACDIVLVKKIDTDNSQFSYSKIFPDRFPIPTQKTNKSDPSVKKRGKKKTKKVIQIIGHMVIPEPYYNKEYIALDTGCCFGGKLSGVLIGKNFLVPKLLTVDNDNVALSYCYKQGSYPLLVKETENFMLNNLFPIQK